MHVPIGRTETLRPCTDVGIVHGSAPVRVEEGPAAVPVERSSVGDERSIAVDPDKMNGKRNMGGNPHLYQFVCETCSPSPSQRQCRALGVLVGSRSPGGQCFGLSQYLA